MSLAFFISNLGQGGAERQLVELVKGIDKSLFDVYLVLFAYQKPAFYSEIFEVENISIISNRLNYNNPILKIVEALLFIRRTIKKHEFSLLFTTLFMNSFLVRLIAPKKYKNRIITSIRTSINLYSRYHLIAEKLLIRNSFIVFNSFNSLYAFMPQFTRNNQLKLFVIYNGYKIVDYPKLNSCISKKEIKIGGLGRQSKEKNFVQLVMVFKNRIEKINSIKETQLIIQGSLGIQSGQIKQLIGSENDKIVLKDASSDTEAFFNDIDILVIPSIYEGCPNVLFEAMIHKRICIISKGANSDNFVINGINGFVYDGTDEGLLRSIINVISVLGTQEENNIVNHAYNYVKKNFSLELMTKQYEDLFLRIYEKNKSSN